jgi:1-acyl-sn-glycerol-3-phosphate acyltransferase
MSEEMADWLHESRQILRTELPGLPNAAARGLARALMVAFHPLLEVEDLDRLAALPEPVIFAFNHNNSAESVLVPTALLFHRRGRPIDFLVDWMFLEIPLLGWVLRQVEPIPVYTKPARWRYREAYRLARADRSPLAAAQARLAAGRSLGIFPEGTRNGNASELRRGRSGLGRLVLLSEAPVVPVGIDFPAKERLGRVPRLGRMRVRIGEPMAFAEERRALRRLLEADPDPGELLKASHAASRRVVDEVMARLAPLCAKRYPYARRRPRRAAAAPAPLRPEPTTV